MAFRLVYARQAVKLTEGGIGVYQTVMSNTAALLRTVKRVNGPYVLLKPSLLLTVRMLSTYGACISLLHQGTMRYGSFDPYGPKTYGACISLLHQGTMPYGSFDPYSPQTYGACIWLLHQGTMRYGSFDPYDPHGKRGALQL